MMASVAMNTQGLRGFALVNASKTHCPYEHEYTPENTITGVKGERVCRACFNKRQATWLRRKRASLFQGDAGGRMNLAEREVRRLLDGGGGGVVK